MLCPFTWERPDAPALTWLTQSGKEGATLTYAQLNAAAAAAARAKPLATLTKGKRLVSKNVCQIAHCPYILPY